MVTKLTKRICTWRHRNAINQDYIDILASKTAIQYQVMSTRNNLKHILKETSI